MDAAGSVKGPPHGPEGEKTRDMPALPGKPAPCRSLSAPNGAPSSAPAEAGGKSVTARPETPCAAEPPVGDGGGKEANPKKSATITRATGKIFLDPRDAAEQPDLHRKRSADGQRACGGAPCCSACRLHEALDASGKEIVRVLNAATRRLWQIDGATLDRLRVAGEKISGKTWPLPNVEGGDGAAASAMYRLVRQLAPGLASGVAATLSARAIAKWQETRWDALVREVKAPSHYKRGFPIPIRAQSFRLMRMTGASVGMGMDDGGAEAESRSARGERYLLRFSLSPGRHPGGTEFSIPLRPRDAYQARVLRMLAGGKVGSDSAEVRIKIGEAKIAEDRRHRGKWLVTFSYTRLRPEERKMEVSAGLNRGIVYFLYGITSTGRTWPYEGNDIEAGLRRIQAQRKRYQRDARASARSGRGRGRILRPIERLEAKGERWRAAKCQTIARRFTQWLLDQDVSVLYLEDFGGIRDGAVERLEGGKFTWDRIQSWPYDQLGRRLLACCEEAGIRVVERPVVDDRTGRGISQTWPEGWLRCGHEEAGVVDLRHRLLRCGHPGCSVKRHLDAVAAENLRQGGERERSGGGAGPGSARSGENTEITREIVSKGAQETAPRATAEQALAKHGATEQKDKGSKKRPRKRD